MNYKFFIFESLNTGEPLSGAFIHHHCQSNGLSSKLFQNCTIENFKNEMKNIEATSIYGENIIINIEVHGNESGLYFNNSEKPIIWDELKSLLYNVNLKIGMRLLVKFSACFGAHFYKVVSVHDGCPYFKFFGPDNPIKPTEIVHTNIMIIDELIKGGKALKFIIDEQNKYLIKNGVKYIYFDAIDLFKRSYSRYINEGLSIETMKKRVDSYTPYFHQLATISKSKGNPERDFKYFRKLYTDGFFNKASSSFTFHNFLEKFLMITPQRTDIISMIDFTFDTILSDNNFEENKSKWLKHEKTKGYRQ